MSLITEAQLHAIAPKGLQAIVTAIASKADEVFPLYGLTTAKRVQHFLAQIAEETGGFTVLVENLNYSAERAHEVWPSRFPTAASAVPYANNPPKLADKVYGGRMGNTQPGDGYRYRGQGLLQCTGRSMFAMLQTKTSLPLVDHPELATDPAHMLEVGVASFTNIPGVLTACDADDVTKVTRLVNGGLINLAMRQAYLAKAKAAIPSLGKVASAPAPVATAVSVARSAAPPPAAIPVARPVDPAPPPPDMPAIAAPPVTPSHTATGIGVAITTLLVIGGLAAAIFFGGKSSSPPPKPAPVAAAKP